jgi:hypothetical protein
VLSNEPRALSWFSFHPTLNSLAILCFTFGSFVHLDKSTRYSRYAYRHSHPSTDVPAKDQGGRAPTTSNRHADRIIINTHGQLGNDNLQGFAQRPTLYNVAQCMRTSFTSSRGTLTRIHSLDLWFDYSLLARPPNRDWRRKRLV